MSRNYTRQPPRCAFSFRCFATDETSLIKETGFDTQADVSTEKIKAAAAVRKNASADSRFPLSLFTVNMSSGGKHIGGIECHQRR